MGPRSVAQEFFRERSWVYKDGEEDTKAYASEVAKEKQQRRIGNASLSVCSASAHINVSGVRLDSPPIQAYTRCGPSIADNIRGAAGTQKKTMLDTTALIEKSNQYTVNKAFCARCAASTIAFKMVF